MPASASPGHFPDLPGADVDQLLAVNMVAPTRLMHHVLPGMRARRRGGVINLASLGGFAPGPYQAPYYASRAYILSLSEAVAARDGTPRRANHSSRAGAGSNRISREDGGRSGHLPVGRARNFS